MSQPPTLEEILDAFDLSRQVSFAQVQLDGTILSHFQKQRATRRQIAQIVARGMNQPVSMPAIRRIPRMLSPALNYPTPGKTDQWIHHIARYGNRPALSYDFPRISLGDTPQEIWDSIVKAANTKRLEPEQ